MPLLVPIEVATRHDVFDVLARTAGLTDDVLVTVWLILQPQLAVGVARPEAFVLWWSFHSRFN